MLFFAGQCQSQFRPPKVEAVPEDSVYYDFFNLSANGVENATYLEPFFLKMYEQRVHGGKKVSIVHVGDSHILGNYLTHEVRCRLQTAFGDAGRGLVFPYRQASSNGPGDYFVEADAPWHGSNCQRYVDPETPFGLSGFLLKNNVDAGRLTIRLRDTSTSETRLFTKVTVFHREDDGPVEVTVHDDRSNQKARLYQQDDFFKSFYFDRPVSQASLSFFRRATEKAGGTIMLDGIMLETEMAGVVYHSIGVNGAKFSDFVRARYFARQLADLSPDLVVLSFGTNEAQGKLTEGHVYQQMGELVAQIKVYAPNTCFLLTTPADSYLKGKGFNPYMGPICADIRRFARENGYALWDLFELAGGEHSAQSWKSAGLMAHDSVHYSKTGYAVQGKLFYQALMRAYNRFVEGKHSDE
ncbi:MAG: GDSL-type esterase/lipase family protein [Saprospiraceae bacterium]